MHHFVCLAEVRNVHAACIDARHGKVKALGWLQVHREITVDVGSAWHVLHWCHFWVFAPCGQLLVAAVLECESALQ